jgi:hypothetical protein
MEWQPEHLETIFQCVGHAFVNFFQLQDIAFLFRTSLGFKKFLYHLLDRIGNSNEETIRKIGRQGRGYDGRLTSYVRWIRKDVDPSLFSCRIHEGMSLLNIIDIAKILFCRPTSEIRLAVGNESSNSEFEFEFFTSIMRWSLDQRPIRRTPEGVLLSPLITSIRNQPSVRKFRFRIDARYAEFYHLSVIGRTWTNLDQLDLEHEEEELNVGQHVGQHVIRSEGHTNLAEGFQYFHMLLTLNISGDFDLSVPNDRIPSPYTQLFHPGLKCFSVKHNSKINNKFFQILTRYVYDLNEVHISDCSRVTVQILLFLTCCRELSVVTLPKRFSEKSSAIEEFVSQSKCKIVYDI